MSKGDVSDVRLPVYYQGQMDGGGKPHLGPIRLVVKGALVEIERYGESKLVQRDSDRSRRMVDLHAEHSAVVFSFLLRLTDGDRVESEDHLQETMLRAWRHIDSLPAGHDELRRWLLTVARHVAVDAYRRRRVRPQEVALTDNVSASYEDVMEIVLAAQTILGALDALTSDQRTLLVEVYVYGWPMSQVAAQRGIPIGTVKSRTHHALKAFRKAKR
ncbi:sigma-70 family RNA polymerase sigma factor [Actinoplanes sp. TBRC 11911]|uniref:sigma-70 family RNA polymerase sigma factor n=1 Tax=Actinoplanes sp. TBRC 11911 TaxID=2729386 RepID=UPI00145CB39C|nr:sigma-70 family RNA polymerase sigma factor [Actinoplanes sp. TBRC 11911]NMO55356.1 sigma-70 family RNA polymerase sigma factor [Actinoplanes sp. TBRC 11911]